MFKEQLETITLRVVPSELPLDPRQIFPGVYHFPFHPIFFNIATQRNKDPVN